MKHTYNNWSTKIFEGFYESNLYNSDILYGITEADVEEGYLKDNQEYDIDNWEAFTKEVAESAVDELLNILPNNDIIQDMTLKDLYSPKYYNYETDSLIIDMKLNLRKLKIFCFKTYRNEFNKYLHENFTSYDGFISFVSNNISSFIEDYKQPCRDREINVMIEFYLLYCIYEGFDFNGETSYHYRLYESANEIVYRHLTVITEDADVAEV